MRYISLFSGIGGFDLGFDRVGMTCVAQVEFDAKARDVLARHWPDVPRFEDVRHVGRANLPAADLVCGGFPCQDVSVAGRRAGLAGERSGLWFEFHRVLDELKPRWVVVENVPGLLSSNGGRDFATVLHGLVGLGYGVCWRVLDAQYFGVAQRRRRVFIVGHLGDGRAAEVLFERDGSAWDSPPRRTKGQGAAGDAGTGAGSCLTQWDSQRRRRFDAAGVAPALSQSDGGGGHRVPMVSTSDLTGTVSAKWAKGTGGPSGDEAQNLVAQVEIQNQGSGGNRGSASIAEPAFTLNTNGPSGIAVKHNDHTKTGYQGDTIVDAGSVGHTLPASGGNNGGGPGALLACPQVSPPLTHEGHDGSEDGTGRHAFALASVLPTPSKESYSPSKASSGQQIDFCIPTPYSVRRLTPVECERLQGFPDGHTDGQSDSARYRQLGNAVCVNVAAWLGRRIMEASR